VTIGGVHVGGLSPQAAYQAVRISFASPLVIVAGSRKLTVLPGRLGAVAYTKAAIARARSAPPGAKIAVHVVVHGDLVREYVDTLAAKLNRKAVDAAIVLHGFRPFVKQERIGHRIDKLRSVKTLTFALSTNRKVVPLHVKELKPKKTKRDFGPVIVIRRSSNRLYLYDGFRFVRRFGVATGQAVYPTPLGNFNIVVMWKYPWWYPPNSDWARGLKPVPPGPGNPLGTRWMGLSTPGVGIHGTPNAWSIGYSASHGCIRMLIPDAEWLFEHVVVGTPVFIVDA
jgi:lipoprotein-anchoring transpeptidase ErfK/SrfK